MSHFRPFVTLYVYSFDFHKKLFNSLLFITVTLRNLRYVIENLVGRHEKDGRGRKQCDTKI